MALLWALNKEDFNNEIFKRRLFGIYEEHG